METNLPLEEKNSAVQSEKKRDYFLPVSILIAGAMISGSVLYLVSKTPSGNSQPAGGQSAVPGNNPPVQVAAVGDRDVILGDPKAPVTIIEYGDYQCPVCGRFFSDVEPLVRQQYVQTGKVRMVYRNFAFLGQESLDAAEASECAKDLQKFWAFHDAVYKKEMADGSENNGNMTRDFFIGIAKDIGLDTKAFATCVDGRKYANVVQEEITAGRNAGVDATPTFFINGQKIRGLAPFEGVSGLKAIIESALKTK